MLSADELALVAMIHADPRDTLPRLVYADWLEEHGHGDMAAFIRLHIEINSDLYLKLSHKGLRVIHSWPFDTTPVGLRLLDMLNTPLNQKLAAWVRPFPRSTGSTSQDVTIDRGMPTLDFRLRLVADGVTTLDIAQKKLSPRVRIGWLQFDTCLIRIELEAILAHGLLRRATILTLGSYGTLVGPELCDRCIQLLSSSSLPEHIDQIWLPRTTDEQIEQAKRMIGTRTQLYFYSN